MHHVLSIRTRSENDVHDLTPELRRMVQVSGVRDGMLVVSSRHTPSAVTINENEPRLIGDLKCFPSRRIPKADDCLHNDIEVCSMPDEPHNAHARLAVMLIGAWQSVLFVELDGPRERQVSACLSGGPDAW